MKTAFATYELKPNFSFGPKTGKTVRQGALLRFDFPKIGFGYADCHPWETLGDISLERQLSLLKEGKQTPLTRRSFFYAQIDANARAEKKSLFENATLPKSHFLITDYFCVDLPAGWEIVKIKLRDKLPQVAEKLNRETEKWNGKIRLDGNNLFTQDEVENFLTQLSPATRSRIDFFEDPFLFHPDSWRNVAGKFLVPLAKDHGAKPDEAGYDTVILKPAVQDLAVFQKSKKRKIVTSYLGHPLGQLCAGYEAARQPTEVCGLLSHLAYELNPYSERLRVTGSQLIPPEGTGFGFDSLLKRESWRAL